MLHIPIPLRTVLTIDLSNKRKDEPKVLPYYKKKTTNGGWGANCCKCFFLISIYSHATIPEVKAYLSHMGIYFAWLPLSLFLIGHSLYSIKAKTPKSMFEVACLKVLNYLSYTADTFIIYSVCLRSVCIVPSRPHAHVRRIVITPHGVCKTRK